MIILFLAVNLLQSCVEHFIRQITSEVVLKSFLEKQFGIDVHIEIII